MREFGWSNEKCREPLGINQTGSVIPGRKDKDSYRLPDSGLPTLLHLAALLQAGSPRSDSLTSGYLGSSLCSTGFPGTGICVLSSTVSYCDRGALADYTVGRTVVQAALPLNRPGKQNDGFL